MVRFVTTAYTHMYENSYVGLPGERLHRKRPQELTDVGIRVEKWRGELGLKVADLIEAANNLLPPRELLDAQTYWEFVRGQSRITGNQIRAIAKTLGTTVHIMTHYAPGHVPEEELIPPEPPATIKVDASAERAARKRKAKGAPKPKQKPIPVPYDADEAARLLAERFGDRVRRAK